MTYQIEFKKEGKLSYYTATIISFDRFVVEIWEKIRISMARINSVPTGRIFLVYKSKINPYISSSIFPDSVLMERKIPISKIDLLCFQYEFLSQQLKEKEKEIKDRLTEIPENMEFGDLFGAMNVHTVSYRPSYADLWSFAKEKVAGTKFAKLFAAEEAEVIKPHKSSSRSLQVFTINKAKEKKSKIWRENK
jgi:hypothetical protein